MLGLFKKKMAPDGPVDFTTEMQIEASPFKVYSHLDWLSEDHTYRALGEHVETIDSARGFYRMHVAAMPGHQFDFAVTEAEPGKRYGYVSETRPIIGRLVDMHSRYELVALNDGTSCLVKSHGTARFVDGLTQHQLDEEMSRMSLACHNSLAKLKIHAEYGIEAVRNATMASVQRVRVES
jgi:hypothetical protein